jgi:hypothetical protein
VPARRQVPVPALAFDLTYWTPRAVPADGPVPSTAAIHHPFADAWWCATGWQVAWRCKICGVGSADMSTARAHVADKHRRTYADWLRVWLKTNPHAVHGGTQCRIAACTNGSAMEFCSLQRVLADPFPSSGACPLQAVTLALALVQGRERGPELDGVRVRGPQATLAPLARKRRRRRPRQRVQGAQRRRRMAQGRAHLTTLLAPR